MTEEVKTQETASSTVEAAQAGLSLNELAIIANVINLATQRGAFKANELSSVGAAYDKLNAFLMAAQSAINSKTEEGDTDGQQ